MPVERRRWLLLGGAAIVLIVAVGRGAYLARPPTLVGSSYDPRRSIRPPDGPGYSEILIPAHR